MREKEATVPPEMLSTFSRSPTLTDDLPACLLHWHSHHGVQAPGRDLLPSTVPSTDPRQYCVPSQFGSSVIPNANMPNVLSSHVYSGWSILPPESINALATRNDMIQRSLGIPFLYGSSIPAAPASFHGRSMLPANDLHFHQSTLRNLQGNSALVATGPYFLESWEQRCRRLRRGTGNQKVLDSDTDLSKYQGEFKILDQTRVAPCEKDGFAKDLDAEGLHNRKSKPPAAPAQTRGHFEVPQRTPWAAHSTSLKAKTWDGGKEKPPQQSLGAATKKSPGLPSALPGTHGPLATGETLSLDEDMQKWTIDDVTHFIHSLPGCSAYAQVFKDHAIDGETLPFLTEEHLRDTMGLRLGPALKIQSQVSQHVQSIFYKKNISRPIQEYSTRQAFAPPADPPSSLWDLNSWSDTSGIPCSQDITLTGIEQDNMRN
ncbi:sterile alpha motif domain-containing protein 7 [Echinops telfairi]|uniref:Sterile alpha motif domain-containing protein 7 n=1 Tax=Echinops telfairi TaxID=9371 RepID=A0ABM0INQ3_ECHTE|nr:sterile alpha motif domain-containing protein 7 [Echinops telfairi]